MTPRPCLNPTCDFWTTTGQFCARCREKGVAVETILDRYGIELRTHATFRTHDPSRAYVTEASEQQDMLDLLHAQGAKTYRIGQRDARKTQDKGPADVIVFHPMCGHFYLEAKRPDGGVQSAEQKEFQRQCRMANVPYVIGAMPALLAFLNDGSA